MPPGSLLWLALAGLLITALTAVATKVLHEFSRHELQEYCRRRKRLKLFDAILQEREQVALRVENLQVLGSTLFVIVATIWLVGPWPKAHIPSWGELALAVVVGSLILLAVTAWIPWAVVRLWATPFLYHTWRVWATAARLMAPFAWCAGLVSVVINRLAGHHEQEHDEEEAFEEEIRSLVTEGLRGGHLEEDAGDMIEGVMELGDADVQDIMTPRSLIDAMPVDLSWAEISNFVINVGRTRIPVYDSDLDDIIGILYVKALLPELAKEDESDRRPLRKILRKPWFVPRTKRLDEMLHEFQQTRNHMAIVVDEYTSVAGLVTIEDVLEEIVGEIVDEYDEEAEEEIFPLDEETAEAVGHAHIDRLNDRLGIELSEEEEFDTIAGLLLSRWGRIPTPGRSLEESGVRITVLDATRRKIERVKLEILPRNGRVSENGRAEPAEQTTV